MIKKLLNTKEDFETFRLSLKREGPKSKDIDYSNLLQPKCYPAIILYIWDSVSENMKYTFVYKEDFAPVLEPLEKGDIVSILEDANPHYITANSLCGGRVMGVHESVVKVEIITEFGCRVIRTYQRPQLQKIILEKVG